MTAPAPTATHPAAAEAASARGSSRPATLPDLCPRLDPGHFAVGRFEPDFAPPADLPGFSACVRSAEEVTLVALSAAYDDLPEPIALEHGWRRITFPGPLPWEQVGFLADVATRLAAARIPFTSMSGFTTDHVLVRTAAAEVAVAVLRGQAPPPLRPDVINP